MKLLTSGQNFRWGANDPHVIAAAQAIEEAKSKAEALAILQKQWEDSFAIASDAIARSKALQDAAKKAKEASQCYGTYCFILSSTVSYCTVLFSTVGSLPLAPWRPSQDICTSPPYHPSSFSLFLSLALYLS